MTREDAERKIRSVFTNYFQFAGNREADEVIEALRQEPCEYEELDFVQPHKKIPVNLVPCNPKEVYNKGFADGKKALAEHLKMCKEELLDKIRAEIAEEKEHAYADFERYKVEYLGQDWEDVLDSLPQDDFRYGMERCIEIIDEYRAEREGMTEQEIKKGGEHG